MISCEITRYWGCCISVWFAMRMVFEVKSRLAPLSLHQTWSSWFTIELSSTGKWSKRHPWEGIIAFEICNAYPLSYALIITIWELQVTCSHVSHLTEPQTPSSSGSKMKEILGILTAHTVFRLLDNFSSVLWIFNEYGIGIIHIGDNRKLTSTNNHHLSILYHPLVESPLHTTSDHLSLGNIPKKQKDRFYRW